MAELPENFLNALKIISESMKGTSYTIRGTTSLVLQGLEMGLEDIDIISDGETALKTNELLKDYLVRPVEYSESKKFKSYFGEFKIEGVKVEVMGNWQILTTKGVWSEIHDCSVCTDVIIDGLEIPVTTIEEELKVFIEMGRWNAYHKMKKQVSSFSQEGKTRESKSQLPSREKLEDKKPDPQLSLF